MSPGRFGSCLPFSLNYTEVGGWIFFFFFLSVTKELLFSSTEGKIELNIQLGEETPGKCKGSVKKEEGDFKGW